MLQNLYYLIVIIVKLPFRALGYLAKHRALAIVVLIGVIAFAAYHTLHKAPKNPYANIEIPYYQKIAPTKAVAPHVLQTVSPELVYYYSKIQDDGTHVILEQYYYYDKNHEWTKGTMPLPLLKKGFQDMIFYDR